MLKTKRFPHIRKVINAPRFISLGFIFIIIIGAALLLLPVSSRDGTSCGLMTALFTATSSTCVTGLSLADTWSQWSGFGQAVILTLIQIGGLGFMTAASIVFFLFKKKINMREQILMAQSTGTENASDIVRIQKRVIFCGLLTEAVGALILALHFAPRFGAKKALTLGVFHSVSAFCNAGFDIFGFIEPGTSIISFGKDPVVCLTLSVLIILGGIGFAVWDDLIRVKSPRRWSIYTKLVIGTTLSLLAAGTVLFCLTEWNNPLTLGQMNLSEKLNAAFFQSATTRTAGFAGIDQGALTDAGKGTTMLLMLIGGSTGSTAGGIKTVTFAVIILFLWSYVHGRENTSVYRRTINNKNILNALTISGIMLLLSFAGAVFICATSPVGFTDAVYESVSAIATVGLSTGITSVLSLPAKLLIIIYMFFGRVGILTISLGFMRSKISERKYSYAHINLPIG